MRMPAAARANDSYVTSVTRLSEAAGYMGLEGVQRICASVLDNLDHIDADDADARVLVRPFFTEWAPLLEAHLRDAECAGAHRMPCSRTLAAAGCRCRSKPTR